jgi:membrane-associated phospholipid phosphatase
MTVAYISFLVGIVVVAAFGAYVYVATPTKAAWLQNVLGRLSRIRDTCVEELGRYGGAVAVLIGGSAAAVIVMWPLGRIVRRYQPNIDVPIFNWTFKHFRQTGSFHHLNAVLTHMGNRPEIKPISIVAAIVLGALWAKRGFWIPTLVLAATFGFEKFGASALGKVVDRGHPPTSHGTFPSGGCARLIMTYGIIFYLVLLTWPAIGRRWRVLGWTVIGILAFVEGFTRVFLFKHWFTDVLAGWLYGVLMLLAMISAVWCLRPKPVGQPERAAREPATVG